MLDKSVSDGLAIQRLRTYSSDMKTVSVRQASDDFPALLRLVAEGEAIEVLERKRPVARILPPAPKNADWSNARERLRALWGGKRAPGKRASEMIREGRR